MTLSFFSKLKKNSKKYSKALKDRLNDLDDEIGEFLKEKFSDLENNSFTANILKMDKNGRVYLKTPIRKDLEISEGDEFIVFTGNKILIVPCKHEIPDILGEKND